MTLEEINTLLKTSGLPVVYRAWPDGSAPPLPWICYLETSPDNFAADGGVYHSSRGITVELYTRHKSPDVEAQVEAVLTGAGIYWEKTETYIDSERCYQFSYDIEV